MSSGSSQSLAGASAPAGASGRSGISTRRSACDECRFSKSKCLRQRPEQARCDRCLRSDSECIISPIFRMRNWEPPSRDTMNFDHESLGAETLDISPSKKKRPRQTWQGRDQGSMNWLPVSPETGFTVPSVSTYEAGPHGGVTDLELLGNNLFSTFDMETERGQSVGLSSYFGAGPNAPIPMAVPPPPPPAETELTAYFQHELPLDISTTETFTSKTGWNSVEWNAQEDPMVFDNAPFATHEPTSTRETPLVRLSKLDKDLVAMLIQLEQGVATTTIKELLDTGAESSGRSIAHQILDKTTEYIQILKHLVGISCGNHESETPSSSGTSSWSSVVTPSPTTNDSSDSIISSDSPVATTRCRTQSASSFSAVVQKRLELDMAGLLSVLAAYMRLVQLYLVLFTHIHRYLVEISQSNSPQLGPMSGLAFSTSFPMQSGNLQTLILIQIVTNLFENIDDLLALPKEFRMSKRRRTRQGAKQGILDLAPRGFSHLTHDILLSEQQQDKKDFTTTTTRKRASERRGNTATGSHGPSSSGNYYMYDCKGRSGGIKVLRRYIAEVKHLLRENIAP
ncbi:hypothetical protein QBC37DRAFT_298651 [Rhypophila decipiens]|uniref:Zn(2)-C6 fungal-type domain-containing protein n=1 Tax=Rhypophila decipiens TaxID=261697 RepID=A0AAN7B435_9PEZI|nr:hypothetical protein QBC37DRAFT_298651 [Rhypophila decipiens]